MLEVDVEISPIAITFLDMTVAVDALARTLMVRLYQKPMNAYLYIPYSSEHPRHTWLAMIKNERLGTRVPTLSLMAEMHAGIEEVFRCNVHDDLCILSNSTDRPEGRLAISGMYLVSSFH